MELIKGDKVKQVAPIKGFDFVGKIFTVVGVNKEDGEISLRFNGTNKDLFPLLEAPSDFLLIKNSFTFAMSKEMFENELNKTAYFEKVYEWTPWRKINDIDNKLKDYIVTEAVYKTNRKTIFVKINGKKVKVTCHKNDTFDLDTGLDIGVDRWIEKYKNFTAKERIYANFVEKNNTGLLDMPCYYYIAHCISTDYNLAGHTAKKIDELYDMKNKVSKYYGMSDKGYNGSLVIGETYPVDNVFNLVTNAPYKKMTMEDLTSCVKDLAEQCRELEVLHLAIPHFGCRNGNLKWEEVKKMIIEVFNEEYVPYDNSSTIEIVACDNIFEPKKRLIDNEPWEF